MCCRQIFSINHIQGEEQKSNLFDSLSIWGQLHIVTGFTEGEIQGFIQNPKPILELQLRYQATRITLIS